MNNNMNQVLNFLSRATLAALVVVCLLHHTASAQSNNDPKIEIFTTADRIPPRDFDLYRHAGIDFVVTVIPDLLKIEHALSQGLPDNEAAALPLAKARMTEYADEINQAWQGNIMIYRYRLTHLPAIVFNDGEAVWYGTNVKQALDAYKDAYNAGSVR